MAGKRDWLDAGIGILAEDGAPALTLERLTDRLNLTKGSFYHHFKGMAGYKTDLLAYYESEHTGRFVENAERAGEAAGARLERLMELVLESKDASDDLENAVRAWALQDGEVRALQERVDRLRVDYLRELVGGLGAADRERGPLARLFYLLLVGAQQVVPPVPGGELREIYTLALRLAPREDGRTP
ncbi:TetR/AcrR family transcriptional regulator [Actinomadura sp. WAC 06369]|uniref:TetR/AcrR family transcriptional regulator n=1 Tax=Actinomadura sp. WAC 06369 TaxID=2203193 RepID=UPI000F77DF11|nr:TetR/AcrR family transcriptional regulator [Actinomadura sp. WAC 06369]RSN64687.1 TetR/AcrR family transcriptional regulator [Actinomadura sp. WAC 06369]